MAVEIPDLARCRCCGRPNDQRPEAVMCRACWFSDHGIRDTPIDHSPQFFAEWYAEHFRFLAWLKARETARQEV